MSPAYTRLEVDERRRQLLELGRDLFAEHGWFMDGAILDWIEQRDLDRAAVRDLLLGTLFGALQPQAKIRRNY